MKVEIIKTTRRSDIIVLEIPDDQYLALRAAVTWGLDSRNAANVEDWLDSAMDRYGREETMDMEWSVQRTDDAATPGTCSTPLVELLEECQ